MRRGAYIVLALTLVACNAKRAEHSSEVVVSVMEVDSVANEGTACHIGYVEPLKEASVMALHGGRVTRVTVREGSLVREGEVIAEIESQSVRSAVAAAEASLRQAEDGLRRARQVYETHSIAEVQMIEVETKVEQARAAAAASRKALDECKVRAPFAGIVSSVGVNVGEEVTPATLIAIVMDISEVRLRISVPEREINGMAIGDTAEVLLPSIEKRTRATVSSKGIVGSPLAHTYECRLAPTERDAEMMPGMICKVFPRRREAGVGIVVIPAEVVRMDDHGRYVWCVKRDSCVEKRYVTLGEFVGRGVMVTSGVRFGDKVITKGTQKVSSGMKVRY